MRQFLHATITLSGLIIGVGIFAVPFVAAQTGFLLTLFWIAILGAVTLFVHGGYGYVVAMTPGKHRLAGYINYALGKHWKRAALVIDAIRLWGLQIAYIIVGGTFLSILLSPYLGGTSFTYSIIIFVAVSAITFFGLRLVERVEYFMVWALIAAFLAIIAKGSFHIEISNLAIGSTAYWFIPYGVILAALNGSAAIPEMWDIVKQRKKVFAAAIIVGTIIPILITALFTLVVVGVSGAGTSEEAIAGLQGALGNGVVYFGALIGLFAVITSYLVLALYLQETFRYDFSIKHVSAWIMATWIPMGLFFVGVQSFINIIDVIGGVLISADGILIIIVALCIIARKKSRWRKLLIPVGIVVGILLAIGLVQKILQLV